MSPCRRMREEIVQLKLEVARLSTQPYERIAAVAVVVGSAHITDNVTCGHNAASVAFMPDKTVFACGECGSEYSIPL